MWPFMHYRVVPSFTAHESTLPILLQVLRTTKGVRSELLPAPSRVWSSEFIWHLADAFVSA
jgi:hypothetical protein